MAAPSAGTACALWKQRRLRTPAKPKPVNVARVSFLPSEGAIMPDTLSVSKQPDFRTRYHAHRWPLSGHRQNHAPTLFPLVCARTMSAHGLVGFSETAKPPGCDSQRLCLRPPSVPHEGTARLGCRLLHGPTKLFCQALMALSGQVVLLRCARIVCRRCAATVWPGVMRCPTCGALSPTSEIRAAILSPSAFVLLSLLALIVTL